MKFYVLASLIIFSGVLYRAIRRSNKLQEKAEESFWGKEREANHVRRKSLDNLNYIQIPFEKLPVNVLTENETVQECLEVLHTLDTTKIVNLTGYSNTDLKLEYGTANITALSEYDQNYTLLVCTLQKWAEALQSAGYPEETKNILEFAVSTRTDISKSYYLLASLYTSSGEPQRIDDLLKTAETLRSASRNAIVRTLQESYQYNG